MSNTTSNASLCEALNMVRKAADFYADAVSACHDSLGTEFFRWLADEKTKLADSMAEVSASLGAGSAWVDACPLPAEAPAGAVDAFRAKAKGRIVSGEACVREVEALRTALEMERGLSGFFQRQVETAKDGAQKDFMRQLLGESRQHVILVEDMLAYYEDPAAWAGGMGRVDLDG